MDNGTREREKEKLIFFCERRFSLPACLSLSLSHELKKKQTLLTLGALMASPAAMPASPPLPCSFLALAGLAAGEMVAFF